MPVNRDVDPVITGEAGVVFPDNPPKEVPKCEECAHYNEVPGIAIECGVSGRMEALDDVRGSDGACGPAGRMFKLKDSPKCEDCKWLERDDADPNDNLCKNPRRRFEHYCRWERTDTGNCGPTGRLFKRRVV